MADRLADQTRSEVLARNGVVASSEPLVTQAGLKILQDGGNAVDAGGCKGHLGACRTEQLRPGRGTVCNRLVREG